MWKPGQVLRQFLAQFIAFCGVEINEEIALRRLRIVVVVPSLNAKNLWPRELKFLTWKRQDNKDTSHPFNVKTKWH